jgi:PPOX class probable F420-dependent enzyme
MSRSVRPVPGRRPPAERVLTRLAARFPPPGMREIARVPLAPAQAQVGKHALLVTFRRDGSAVATPVWAAPAAGRLYVRTARGSPKVARLRRDARVLVAPCTARGRPLGPPFEARARVLAPEEEAIAERALSEFYGRGRALFEWSIDRLRVDMCYLELEPATAE